MQLKTETYTMLLQSDGGAICDAGLLLVQRRKSIKVYGFFKSVASIRSVQRTHGRLAAVSLHNVKHNHVLDENRHSFQYERHKQVHVDVVSCAVQLPVKKKKSRH